MDMAAKTISMRDMLINTEPITAVPAEYSSGAPPAPTAPAIDTIIGVMHKHTAMLISRSIISENATALQKRRFATAQLMPKTPRMVSGLMGIWEKLSLLFIRSSFLLRLSRL